MITLILHINEHRKVSMAEELQKSEVDREYRQLISSSICHQSPLAGTTGS